MNKDSSLIHLIENLAFNAWPSNVNHTFEEWKIRASFGVTKRANSVYTIGKIPTSCNWLEYIENFYKERSIRPCFYISDISPSELDSLLQVKGYKKFDSCFIMAVSCNNILEKLNNPSPFMVEQSPLITVKWIKDFIELEGYSIERQKEYMHIFSAIKPLNNFLSIYENDTIVGLGTVVVEQGWGCISNVVVDRKHRRKGIALEIIKNLTEWAYKNGAYCIYLQVVKENQAAVALYNKLGFTPIAEHHYRVLREDI